MSRYSLNWKKMKQPESIVLMIFGFIAGVMLGHPGTNFLIDVLVISVVSGLTNWWMARYMDKRFPDAQSEASE